MGNNVIDIWPGRGFDSVISFAAFIPCTQFSKCLIVSERVRCTSWYPHMCACSSMLSVNYFLICPLYADYRECFTFS